MNLWQRYLAWLDEAARCDEPAPSGQKSDERPASALAPFVSVHPPGSVVGDQAALRAERAPLLIDVQRHRRIPIDWAEVLDIEGPQAALNDALRHRVERLWLSKRTTDGVIPDFIKAPGGEYVSRRLDINLNWSDLVGSSASSLKENLKKLLDGHTTPKGRLIIADRPEDAVGRRFFALEPSSALELEAGKSRWVDVKEALEVFPRKPGASDSVAGPSMATLESGQEALGLASTKALSALPFVSSAVPVWTLQSRILLAWRKQFLADVLADYVRRANRADGQSQPALWRLAQEKSGVPADLASEPWWAKKSGSSRELHCLEKFTENDAWVIRSGDRWYRVVWQQGLDAAEVAKIDLTQWEQYESAWDGKIADLEPLAWAVSSAATSPDFLPFSYLESVDISPHLILEEFARAKTDFDIATATGELGKKLLEELKSGTGATPERVAETVNFARDLRSTLFDAEWKIRRLKERAQRLGYYLATGLTVDGKADNTFNRPTGPDAWKTETVEVGRLYMVEERAATFQVRQSSLKTGWNLRIPSPLDGLSLSLVPLQGGSVKDVLSSIGSIFGRRKKRVDRVVNVEVRYPALKEVTPSTEPWEDMRQKLQSSGFQCVVAELTDDGYATRDGTPVREMLRRCLFDEAYRTKLAIFLPLYQERLEDGIARVRYVIAVRPEPGDEPVGFPSLFVEESISYRAEWRGVELGQLLHSISLAPGEERSVTFSRTIERTAERVDSITSVLDVTRAERLDLSSQIQTTVSREKNSKSSSNWNASAQASVGWFGGSAGGGGSSEQSVRDFTETIKKSAMQATKEMRVNQRQEVRSSTTTSTKVTTAESTQSTFRNINQGTTLNVLFYQLNNVLDAGFFLDRLRIAYRPSVELIAGSRIHDLITRNLEGAEALCQGLCSDPVFQDGSFTYDYGSVDRRVLLSALQTIQRDYCQDNSNGGTEERSTTAATAALLLEQALVRLPEPLRNAFGQVGGSVLGVLERSATQEAWKELGAIRAVGKAFQRHELVTPSTACYADCVVGALPGTEPYSEAMRSAEIRARNAEVEHVLADASRLRSGKESGRKGAGPSLTRPTHDEKSGRGDTGA